MTTTLVVFLLSLLTGCQTIQAPHSPALEDARLEAETNSWLETSLYYALRRVEGAAPFEGISEERWIQYLDEEVSTRFPAGFTVFDGYGQWVHMNNLNKKPNRLVSKVIIILHPDTVETDHKIEALREAFTTEFEQESVLRVTHPAMVSF